MINLLSTAAEINARSAKIKHLVFVVTTLILVGYVLVLAGLAGTSWYLAMRTDTVSADVTNLTSRVGQLAEMEAVLRQEDDRLKLINAALKNRLDLARTASILGTANVTDWEYLRLTEVQKVVAVSSNAADLEAYATSLRNKFTTVDIKTLSLRSTGGGQIELLLKGNKPRKPGAG